MASIISAGTSTGTALNLVGDTTGSLALQTNNGTTALTIDTSQNITYVGNLTGGTGVVNLGSGQFYKDASGNVGIGTSSPRSVAGYTSLGLNNTTGTLIDTFVNGTRSGGIATTSTSMSIGSITAMPVVFNTSDTERMRIDSSGNVGIGTSSPAILGASYKNLVLQGGSTTQGGYYFTQTSDGAQVGQMGVDSGVIYTGSRSNHPVAFTTNNTERMRIDASGNLLVGTTSAILSNAKVNISQPTASAWGQITQVGNTANGAIFTNTSGTAQYLAISFRNNGTSFSDCGNIYVSGSTTQYATSSDYRLKENIAPMTGALAKVQQLKPVTYTWKSTGEESQGFIAHELQAVVPDCVTGEKDAVDEEGKPVYQGIDTSFLVATLTAAIQEQQAMITALQADVAALKGAK